MTLQLTAPTAIDDSLERLNFLPGRALGEDELEHLQTYTDARLRSLRHGHGRGIITGLRVSVDAPDTPGDGVTVAPGIAIGGDGFMVGLNTPVTVAWADLVADFLTDSESTAPAGIYYLTLTRSAERVDVGHPIDACQRFELNRQRDSRRVVIGRLSLRKLALPPGARPASGANLVAASHADGTFLDHYPGSVPLALVAINGARRATWLNETAGRYLAVPHSGYRVLHDLTRETLLDAAARSNFRVGNNALRVAMRDLRFLPAAGELPREIISDIASVRPGLGYLPEHLRVDMVPLRASQIASSVARQLPRGLIDLANTLSGDHLRLLLAVPDELYATDLLDIPAVDGELIEAGQKAFVDCHRAWLFYRNQYNRLYSRASLAPQATANMGLPQALGPPVLLADIHGDLVRAAAAALGPGTYPYDQPLPASPLLDAYTDAAGNLPTTDAQAQPGLVVRQALLIEKLDRWDNKIRARRATVEKYRDYQLLQRQQLDRITVAMAKLAGGVSGDGSGLQVARWLPYANFFKAPESEQRDNVRLEAFAVNPAAFAGRGVSAPAAGGAGVGGKGDAGGAAGKAFGSTAARRIASEVRGDRQPPSTFELALDRGIFQKLAEAPRQALTAPAFVSGSKTFGVIDHLRPELSEYEGIYQGTEDLLTTLPALFDPQHAEKLQKELRNQGNLEAPSKIPGTDDAAAARRYRAIFVAGRVATRRIARIEDLYGFQEKVLKDLIRERAAMEAEIEQLTRQIRRARARLNVLVQRYDEATGDYAQGQRLLDEALRDVQLRFVERRRILTEEVTGLYYLKVQNTPLHLGTDLTLPTRTVAADDLVPGCPRDPDAELPESLEPFLDGLTELGIRDWRRLRPLTHVLPNPDRLRRILEQRSLRIDQRLLQIRQQPMRKAGRALNVLQVPHLALLGGMAQRRDIPVLTSKLRTLEEASSRISIDDVLGSTLSSRLRRLSIALRDELEQALLCLLEALGELPPAPRYEWAQLAEDDRLPVADIDRWPGAIAVSRDSYLTVLSASELLAWLFRQLADDHSAEAGTALRTMVRAVVIHAALGEPEEILKGTVLVPPRVLDAGAVIRVRLNRPARLGLRLELFDEQRRVVGLVRVDDEERDDAIVTVLKTHHANVSVNRGFTLSQYRGDRR